MTDPAETAPTSTAPAPRRALLILAACVAAVYLGGVTNRWWPTPDSAVYLGVGRSLAAGEGYRCNGRFCTDAAPGLPVILAGITALCGQGLWAPNLFVAACGLAAIALIYLVLSREAGPEAALCVAAATGLSYLFYFNAHRVLTDVPFAALFWASLYAALRYSHGGSAWWLAPAGLLAAASVAVRIPGVLVIAPAAVGLALDRPAGRVRRRLAAAAAMLAPVAVLGGMFSLLARSADGYTPVYAELLRRWLHVPPGERLGVIGQALAALPQAFARVFIGQRGAGFDQAGLILLALTLIGVGVLWRRGRRLTATVAALYPAVLIVFASAWAVRVRYLLPVQPLLIYAAMEGLCWCVRAVRGRRPRGGPLPAAARILAGLIILANAPKLARNTFYYGYLAWTPRYYQVIEHGRYAEVFTIADIIRRECPPAGRVGLMGQEFQVFSLLGGRPVALLPEVGRRTVRSARAVVKAVARAGQLDLVVLDMDRASGRFRDHVGASLDGLAEMKRVHVGKRYLAYRRVAAGRRARVQ